MVALLSLLPFLAIGFASAPVSVSANESLGAGYHYEGVKIQSLKDGKCLSPDPKIEIGDYKEYDEVDAFPCGEARAWDLTTGSGAVLVSGSAWSLDVGSEFNNGSQTRLKKANSESPLQAWYATNDARLAITNGGQCLDESWDNGPQIYQCTDMSTEQMWIIIDAVTEKLKVNPALRTNTSSTQAGGSTGTATGSLAAVATGNSTSASGSGSVVEASASATSAASGGNQTTGIATDTAVNSGTSSAAASGSASAAAGVRRSRA